MKLDNISEAPDILSSASPHSIKGSLYPQPMLKSALKWLLFLPIWDSHYSLRCLLWSYQYCSRFLNIKPPANCLHIACQYFHNIYFRRVLQEEPHMVHIRDHCRLCLARLDPNSLYMSRNPIQKTVGLNRIVLSRKYCWMENIIGFCRQRWPFIWIFVVAFSYTKLIIPIICTLHPWVRNILNNSACDIR